jgi:hypothetical protein
MTYRRCQCKTGDHDLDGKPDHCLNDAGKGHRLCDDCRKPSLFGANKKATK